MVLASSGCHCGVRLSLRTGCQARLAVTGDRVSHSPGCIWKDCVGVGLLLAKRCRAVREERVSGCPFGEGYRAVLLGKGIGLSFWGKVSRCPFGEGCRAVPGEGFRAVLGKGVGLSLGRGVGLLLGKGVGLSVRKGVRLSLVKNIGLSLGKVVGLSVRKGVGVFLEERCQASLGDGCRGVAEERSWAVPREKMSGCC